jgi:Protein of unknown function (DUF1579)
VEEPLAPQDLLTAMVGDWEGVYRLWLEPGVLRGESPTRATIYPVLHGRYVSQDYEWADQGILQQGTMLLGRDNDGVWNMAWVDTWHTAGAVMPFKGQDGSGADVLGSYGGNGEQWGWRTAWSMPDSDHLVVTAWNITPQGTEHKATESTYERRA